MAEIKSFKTYGWDYWDLLMGVVMDAENNVAWNEKDGGNYPYSITTDVYRPAVSQKMKSKIYERATIEMTLHIFEDEQSKKDFDEKQEAQEKEKFHKNKQVIVNEQECKKIRESLKSRKKIE
jgi:hypothetical protein